jgi:hypothetical protein
MAHHKKDPLKVAAGELGGQVRARNLTKDQRKEIATRAAIARWGTDVEGVIRRATHTGSVTIGELKIPCAVLEDGTRVLTENGVTEALGSRSGAAKALKKQAQVEQRASLPIFLAPNNLKPFITNDLLDGPLKPIYFWPDTRRSVIVGFSAEALPAICNVWLQAREAGVLYGRQKDKAQKAELVMRGLATVGITALVDEATGYQADRAKDALARILEQFIAKELRKWVSTFPLDYYRELFRLHDWSFDADSVKRPQLVGKITNDIVYRRLAPGVLDELQRVTPRDEKGRLKNKLFQRLTDEMGHPRLKEHLAAVVALMKASPDMDFFMSVLNRALPRYPKRNPDQLALPEPKGRI